ncbi:MAG: peptidylprolyl isomerase [Phycisphaera sp.]|nr:peptidylprolyl isomerase [Phycisphaera sp.]
MSHLNRLFLLTIVMTASIIGGCGQESSSAPESKASSTGEAEVVGEAGPIRAVVRTRGGEFTIELRPDAAPVSCANFVNLVQRGFFDGLPFYRHSRVIRQVGNPYGDEQRPWNAGYRLTPEFSPDLKFDRAGMVGLLRSADDIRAPVRPNEFFVTTKAQSERFTFVYPIFAVVVEGQSVVDSIVKDETLVSIEIEGDPSKLLADHAEIIVEWNRRLDANDDPRK